MPENPTDAQYTRRSLMLATPFAALGALAFTSGSSPIAAQIRQVGECNMTIGVGDRIYQTRGYINTALDAPMLSIEDPTSGEMYEINLNKKTMQFASGERDIGEKGLWDFTEIDQAYRVSLRTANLCLAVTKEKSPQPLVASVAAQVERVSAGN